jgi:hypothetical protein
MLLFSNYPFNIRTIALFKVYMDAAQWRERERERERESAKKVFHKSDYF